MSTTIPHPPEAAPGTAVGQRLVRREDPALLRGAARYVGDLTLPGMVDIAFVRSPVAHAAITAIDTAAAADAPGVVAVLTAADLASLTPLTDLLEVESHKTPRPALATDRVRYVGEPVVAVVARSRYEAEDACELVEVAYDPLPPVVDVAAAALPDAPLLFDHVPHNTYFSTEAHFGDADAAFAGADHRFRKHLRINRHLANSLEGRAILAHVDPVSGQLTCWMSSQAPFQQRFFLAMALGLPESRVRVVAPAVGGAFGPKDYVFGEDVCTAYAAQLLGRPVRWIEDRVESLTAAPHAKEQDVTVEIALDRDGRIRGMRGRFTSDSGAYASSAIAGLVDCMFAAHGLPGPYDVSDYAYDAAAVLTNKAPVAPYRGVGFTAAQTVRELLLDEAARDLGIDPLELRRRSLLPDDPTVACTGMTYDGGTYRASLDLAAEAIGYQAVRAEQQRAAQQGGRLVGVGLSPFVEMTTMGQRSGMRGGVHVLSHDNATISLDLTGRFTVAVGTCSHGQGHATAFAQVAADALGVDVDAIDVVDGDTATTPWGMGTFASRSAVVGVGTILAAAAKLRAKLLTLGSALLEADPQALEIRDGAVGIRGVPEAQIPLHDLAAAAHFGPGRAILEDPSLVERAFHDPAPTFSNGCAAVVVEIDPDTFVPTVRRAVAVEDCGTVINPLIVEGQMLGGLAQGIGAALYERFVYGADGQPLTTTYADYLLPRATEVPEVELHHLETPSSTNELGVKGMAEGLAIATPAAVLCAIADALASRGFVVQELPLTPDAIWRALGGDAQ